MCGIAGTYSLSEQPAILQSGLDAALHALAHRGPDDQGIYQQGRALLGHRRLSIIDTSAAGHQPFIDDSGRYAIVFNGEAFNFQDLRAELEAEGHTFRSQTDTEVVLRLFVAKGESFLKDINGFFALAIHDRDRDELLIARDRFGVKPLLWCEQDGLLRFASELRALQAMGVHGQVDGLSLLQLLTYHYIAAPHSMLEGVRKLEPGCLLRVSASGVVQARWYDLVEKARGTVVPKQPQQRLVELLDDAVRLRLISDVPIGTFLSGGLDSSIVSALAARHHQHLHTFSIGFADDPFFDETRYAEEVARHIGSEHSTFKLTRNDLAEAYGEFLRSVDEPFADSSALPSYLLCRETRKHVTVALSGDGADEVFGGYRKHQAELRLVHPRPLHRAVIALAPLWRALPRSRNHPLTDGFRRLDRFAGAAAGAPEQRWLQLASFDSDGDAPSLVSAPPREDQLDARLEAMTRGISRMPGLNGYLLADVDTVLSNDMLYKVDLTSMAHGLEVRTPFLDRRVVELAFALPSEVKVRAGEGKRILREAFEPLLPASVLNRPKKGFEVPLRHLFLGPLASTLDTLLDKDGIRSAGLSWSAVQGIRQRLASTNPGQAQATLHALAVFMAWWRTQRF